MHPCNGLSDQTDDTVPEEPIDQGSQRAADRAQHVRPNQPPVPPGYAPGRRQMLFPRNHQAWEIQRILMRRCVRAMVVTELAVVTFIDDAVVIGLRQLGDVAFVRINAVEQRIERGTEVETTAAAVAHLIYPLRLLLETRRVDGVKQTQAVHSSYCPLGFPLNTRSKKKRVDQVALAHPRIDINERTTPSDRRAPSGTGWHANARPSPMSQTIRPTRRTPHRGRSLPSLGTSGYTRRSPPR